MNRLRWLGVKFFEQLKWPGTAGLAMLAACAVFFVVSVLPLQQRLQAVRQAVVASERTDKERNGKRSDPQRELVTFKALFKGAILAEQLKLIHEAGKATGLTLKRVEYRMLEEKRSNLHQYQVVMPVTGSYPRIRQFVALALSKVPSMSLDHVSFQRKKVGDAVVDAELRFTLFLAQPV